MVWGVTRSKALSHSSSYFLWFANFEKKLVYKTLVKMIQSAWLCLYTQTSFFHCVGGSVIQGFMMMQDMVTLVTSFLFPVQNSLFLPSPCLFTFLWISSGQRGIISSHCPLYPFPCLLNFSCLFLRVATLHACWLGRKGQSYFTNWFENAKYLFPLPGECCRPGTHYFLAHGKNSCRLACDLTVVPWCQATTLALFWRLLGGSEFS